MISDDEQVMACFLSKKREEKKFFVENIKKEVMSEEFSWAISLELLSDAEISEYIFDDVSYKNPARAAELKNFSQTRGAKMWDISEGLE